MTYWAGYFIILIGGIILLLGIFARTYVKQQSGSKPSTTIMGNLALSLLAIFLTFMAVEFYFKMFFAQSDAYVFSLSAQNWKERYWYPINSLGYRDQEWSADQIQDKLKIMVVGDSLAAGLGINDYRDRFSDKLNEMLGEDVVVFNVASPGWHTRQEIEAVVDYPYRPDILIVAYFINDIEGAAFHQGVERPRFVQRPPALIRPLIENSYALNFLYWRLVRFGQQEGQADYLQWVSETFNIPEVWWVHQQELQTIYEGSQAEGIDLVVVVFPNISSLEESRAITQPVIDFFRSRGVPTIDVADLVQDQTASSLMVSPVDAHPNEMVHLAVAQRLYKIIQTCNNQGCKDITSN